MKLTFTNRLFIIIFNVLLFFSGIYFFTNPLVFTYYICLYFGILLLIGAFTCLYYFLFKKEARHLSTLLEGVFLGIAGVLLLTNIIASALFFGIILGGFLAFDGMTKIASGFAFKKNGLFGGIFLILFGILSIILSIYVFSNIAVSVVITASTFGLIISINAIGSIFKALLYHNPKEPTE